MEDSFQIALWPLRVFGYAIWTNQRTGDIPAASQQCATGVLGYICYRLPRRLPYLLQKHRKTYSACEEGYGKAPRS